MSNSVPRPASGPRSLLSVMDLDRDDIDAIYSKAEAIKWSVGRNASAELQNRIFAVLFFQQSTRTRFSFEAAILRLGGKVIGFDTPSGTRSDGVWKETLSDAARVMSAYADCIILRHPDVDGFAEFASASSIPVINAGAGTGSGSEHPTQALLDVFTIRETFGGVDGLEILLVGGMQLRTVSSFVKLIRLFPGCVIRMFPSEGGAMPPSEQAYYDGLGVSYEVVPDLDEALRTADVVYHHGLAEDPSVAVDQSVHLNRARLSDIHKHAIILHSLPRVGELGADVDDLPQARYFEQAANGVPVRMALIKYLMSGG